MFGILGLLGIISALLTVAGAYLVNKKRKNGFLFWIAASSTWLFYGILTLQIGIILQHSVLMIFSVSGYNHWSNTPIILPGTT